MTWSPSFSVLTGRVRYISHASLHQSTNLCVFRKSDEPPEFHRSPGLGAGRVTSALRLRLHRYCNWSSLVSQCGRGYGATWKWSEMPFEVAVRVALYPFLAGFPWDCITGSISTNALKWVLMVAGTQGREKADLCPLWKGDQYCTRCHATVSLWLSPDAESKGHDPRGLEAETLVSLDPKSSAEDINKTPSGTTAFNQGRIFFFFFCPSFLKYYPARSIYEFVKRLKKRRISEIVK